MNAKIRKTHHHNQTMHIKILHAVVCMIKHVSKERRRRTQAHTLGERDICKLLPYQELERYRVFLDSIIWFSFGQFFFFFYFRNCVRVFFGFFCPTHFSSLLLTLIEFQMKQDNGTSIELKMKLTFWVCVL